MRKVLYIAPDVPVPHTGEFLGGSTHVLKGAESLAEKGCDVFIVSRRMRGQRKCEKYSGADDIEDEAHLYERGEMPTKDGKEVLSRRIIFILAIQFYKYVGSNLDSHT